MKLILGGANPLSKSVHVHVTPHKDLSSKFTLFRGVVQGPYTNGRCKFAPVQLLYRVPRGYIFLLIASYYSLIS